MRIHTRTRMRPEEGQALRSVAQCTMLRHRRKSGYVDSSRCHGSPRRRRESDGARQHTACNVRRDTGCSLACRQTLWKTVRRRRALWLLL